MDILEKLRLTGETFLEKLPLGALLSEKKLQDPEAVKEPILYTLDPFTLDGISLPDFVLNARLEARHRSHLINSVEEDEDEHGLLPVKNVEEALLPFDAARPIFVHTLQFFVNAGAKAPLHGFQLGIESGAQVQTSAYLAHDPEESVASALLKGFRSMPFVFDLPRIKALQEGEAVLFQSAGSLGLQLSFSSADVLAAGMPAVTKYVRSEALLVTEFEVGAEIGVTVNVEDHYRVAIGKLAGGRYAVAVKKARAARRGVGVSVGVRAAFNEPGKVSQFLNGQVDRLLAAAAGLPSDDLKKVVGQLIEVVETKELPLDKFLESDQAREAFHLLLDRLKVGRHIDAGLEEANELLNRIRTIESDVRTGIVDYALKQISAGFQYEYARINEKQELIRAEVSEAVLEATHKDLVLFNLHPLVERARQAGNDGEIKVQSYFNEKSLLIRRSWGISLGIGDFRVGSMEEKTFERVINQTLDGQQQVAYKTARMYREQGDLGGFGQSWWVDVAAAMPAHDAQPSLRKFDYSCSIVYEHREKRFRKREKERLLQLLDHAALWDILPAHQVEETAERLWQTLSAKKVEDLTFTYKLGVPKDVFDELFFSWHKVLQDQEDAKNLTLLCNAFAGATPYSSEFEGRSVLQRRVHTYSKLWRVYFENEAFSPIGRKELGFRDYTTIAKRLLQEEDQALARWEGRFLDFQGGTGPGDNLFFGGLHHRNEHIGRDMKFFVDGLTQLFEGIFGDSQKYDQVIQRAFQKMHVAFSQSLYVKAIGAYLLEVARFRIDAPARITRQLEIRYRQEGAEQAILLQKATDQVELDP